MTRKILFASVIFSSLSMIASSLPAVEKPAGNYIGSTLCAECHEDKFHLWQETLHANVIKDAREHPEAILGEFNEENPGFNKEDILYTIGSHWDQRYMTKINGEYFVLPKLWAVQSKQWRPYNVWSWNKRPWSRYCAGCHVTGYESEKGDFSEMLVGCESCHGPGEKHANSRKPEDITNPSGLSKDRRDMVCAACHVRGTDLTGNYYFPLDYKPGMDLAEYYIPIDIEDNETPAEAIRRLFSQWALEREESGRGKCEVCGIYGSSDKMKRKRMSEDIMSYCLKCHEFDDKLADHLRHTEEVHLVCLDCHRAKPFSLDKEKVDVHSVQYYRIHQESCYDEDIDKACIDCHKDKDRAWALREILMGWKKLPELDH